MCDKDARITFVVSIWDQFHPAFIDLDSSRSGVGSRLVLFNRALYLQFDILLKALYIFGLPQEHHSCARSIPGPVEKI